MISRAGAVVDVPVDISKLRLNNDYRVKVDSYSSNTFHAVAGRTYTMTDISGQGILLGFIFRTYGEEPGGTRCTLSNGLGNIGVVVTIDGVLTQDIILEGYGLGIAETQRPSVEAITHDWHGAYYNPITVLTPLGSDFFKHTMTAGEISSAFMRPSRFKSSLNIEVIDHTAIAVRRVMVSAIYLIDNGRINFPYRYYCIGHNNCVEINVDGTSLVYNINQEGIIDTLSMMVVAAAQGDPINTAGLRAGLDIYIDGEATPSIRLKNQSDWTDWAGHFFGNAPMENMLVEPNYGGLRGHGTNWYISGCNYKGSTLHNDEKFSFGTCMPIPFNTAIIEVINDSGVNIVENHHFIGYYLRV